MTKDLQGSLIFLHGPPKIGKTQLAASFPGPIVFYATEPGHKFLSDEIKKAIVQCPIDGGWQIFSEHVAKELKKTKAKTVVIDTIDNLYTQCTDFVCAKEGYEHPSDGDYGKGWEAVRKEMLKGLLRLADVCGSLNATIIFISHTQIDEIVTRTSKTSRISCTLTGAARKVILPIPDYIWYLGYDAKGEDAFLSTKKNRALWLKGTDAIEAGTRDASLNVGVIRQLNKDNPYQHIIDRLNNPKVEKVNE